MLPRSAVVGDRRERDAEEEPLIVEQSSGDESGEVDYETAISAAGYGRFHWWFLLVCGWANGSDAVEVLCVSFLLPAAECDLELSSKDKGWLSAIVFVGMLVGGYLWGTLGDTFGRRKTLMTSLLVNALCGSLSSLAQDKYTFLVMRFLSGVGVGGSIPIVWAYFGEFQPMHKRGRMLSFLAAFWMVGNITVAGIAWAVIPFDIGYNTTDPDEFEYNSWRIFVALCGLPALLVSIALIWCPESPKFLIAKGHNKEAVDIFAKIFATNTGKPKSDYPIKRISYEVKEEQRDVSFSEYLSETYRNTVRLFHADLVVVTLLMLFINFAIQFGYYGLWLWFPELFNKLDEYYDEHPDASKTVCEITEYQAEDECPSNDPFCFCDERYKPDNEVFINSFIISLAALPGNIWTILQMDSLGRKFFLALSMVLSGLCAFLIYTVSSTTANLLVSCAFGLVSTMGFNALDCLSIELFPTEQRSTAMAVTLITARLGAILGNLVFGYLVDVNCAIPILSVAALLIVGGVAGIFLPNTTRTALA